MLFRSLSIILFTYLFWGSGYVDNEEATAAILDSEGWLRTGDLCYINIEGFLFFVDRIKELIKYNVRYSRS